jgi:hypothetical protein
MLVTVRQDHKDGKLSQEVHHMMLFNPRPKNEPGRSSGRQPARRANGATRSFKP